jgi:phospholipid/cholesterol/gamma-HCH transport system ATP-binding protein
MDIPLVEVRQLWLASGSRVLQRDLSFEVQRGQVLALVGEDGAGKRPLLRAMVGLEPPSEGDVYYDGIGLWGSSDAERSRLTARFGVLLAGGALLSSKTLLENVALPLEVHTHLPNRDVRSVARLKLAVMGLAGYENHYPGEVDGQRRVSAALARATALDPEVLFCERPTAELDPKAATFVTESILRARDHLGATVVVVSNDAALVLAADEAVFLGMESKTMKARGRPTHLREHAEDPDVRAFLGGGRAVRVGQ